MNTHEQMKNDLDYVVAAVRRNDRSGGSPMLYAFWALAILVGFALVDFAPHIAGPYWMVVGIGGGLGSTLYASRESRRQPVVNAEQNRRWGIHFVVGGIGWLLVAASFFAGHGEARDVATGFLLVTGLVYALAGVHLDRLMLWSGLVALAGYAVMQWLPVPYLWTTTGAVMAASLGTSAVLSARGRG